jgi:hypothetical protein
VKQIRKRITYANVMSSIAVFLVLGGGAAYAAKKIGSNEIKGNSITTGKIKKEAVSASKIKKNAITTAKIANGAVTGAKLNLGTVGTVPNAAHAINADNANNANTVGGRSVTKIFVKIPVNSTVTIGTFGVFKIAGTCSAGGNVENLELDPQTTDTDIAAFGDGNTGVVFERNQGAEDNSINLNGTGVGENVRGIATFSAAQSGGAVVTGTLAYDDTASFNGENVCAVYGQVIS